MDRDAKIYVAGHRGLVGSALMRRLHEAGYQNTVSRAHAELDLMDPIAVNQFFAEQRPDYVFLAAAKVGGILANNTYPADFIYNNICIQNNVLRAAQQYPVQRLLFLGSSCIYPKAAPQPMKEEYLNTGTLEPTNRPYAMAKLAGIEQCWSFNRQYKTRFLAVMPTNLYGPGDSYDLQNSHVLPALIRKFHEAKVNKTQSVVVWGSGTPKRELLFSADMADACVYLMNLEQASFDAMLGIDRNEGLPPLINIGTGVDHSIREIAEMVRNEVGYTGDIQFDTSRPDGTPRKLLDVSRLAALGWQSKTDLTRGLRLAYAAYLEEHQPKSVE